ncbi:uncharacterized protein B0H18DRAFT_67161 [Fomitopsis serialis]|uniref:uncharacterized protein n=1 Tax=Fomitopsis serialis TaxID=139415 RepID=UPI002007FE43|nr:uncharacterized protein B0H18DRAFT_67161 [Neoantrodia serialis]KAH9931793.1 hypothetical protein B0H18DRAFT_67161 [Neoantrodia serialis]
MCDVRVICAMVCYQTVRGWNHPCIRRRSRRSPPRASRSGTPRLRTACWLDWEQSSTRHETTRRQAYLADGRRSEQMGARNHDELAHARRNSIRGLAGL